jgi:hypothetical protein
MVYRLGMLLWALWLASALLGWLNWGWGCFSEGGLWRSPDAIGSGVAGGQHLRLRRRHLFAKIPRALYLLPYDLLLSSPISVERMGKPNPAESGKALVRCPT